MINRKRSNILLNTNGRGDQAGYRGGQVGDYDTMVVKVVVVAVVMMDKAVKLAPKEGIMLAHVGTL
jgi:hypothetical protein